MLVHCVMMFISFDNSELRHADFALAEGETVDDVFDRETDQLFSRARLEKRYGAYLYQLPYLSPHPLDYPDYPVRSADSA